MKKTLIIAAFAGLTFASCKKDRTCTCTSTNTSSTVNGVSQTVSQPQTTVTKLTKTKKGSADCNSGEQTVNYTYVYGGTSYAIVDVTKNDCKLS